ncbi:hypothetical protein E4U09_001124 [Claviceps aff. purpurea]|uniref:Uncharacterized protein n=1 Tax=Claviceps aff. purpurea TaxID=1967640 RepID=A0A9P7U6T9_9HYPO|nr:hypothetical protein E4U09_001124 [Claviceps aff. purpurea]
MYVDKDISYDWKDCFVDPTDASPQDATDWMANRIQAYTEDDLTQDELLAMFRDDFKDWPFGLFNDANSGVRLCLRNILQKKGIETKKGSGDSVPKILYDITKYGKAEPDNQFSPAPYSAPVPQASPTRPGTPANHVNETLSK